MSASEVSALSLGRITVQSALGEPLKAEVDVPNITAEEAATLKASIASPAAFVAAGLDYNPAMTGLQITLARKADGRAYIRLTSDRPINDPFVDMILEASWSSGRIVRDYTMLFDPPSLKQAAAAPTLAQTSPAASVSAKTSPATPSEATRPAVASKPAAAAKPKTEGDSAQRVTVQSGDSASKIALRAKASDVSLDQMLVAMLRANPDAFTQGNLNRLRAGAVLDMPNAEQAKAIAPAEATETVLAQSKDFNAFRRSLAGSAPKAAVEAADRKAAGSVQAKVEDKKPGSTAADKLTLSKGGVQPKVDEAKLAKERVDKEAASRAAELAKNIADLSKLSAASANTAPAAAPASQPAPAAPALSVAAVPPPAPEVMASEPPKPAAAASAPAKPVVAPPVPVEEPSLVDQLLEDPTLPLAGGGILALLGGFILYRRKRGKKPAAHVDSSFLDSRLQPDSFFGASGGQRVDTTQDGAPESAASSSSYTNSQMGLADDVDPVAEADVYLAYGRDLQAEEILKEALRSNPTRFAIHSKLLDIYAKRRDAASFLATANTAFKLVGADSADWARICELGLSIDPDNPLYQPGGASASAFVHIEQQALDAAPGDGAQSEAAQAAMPQAMTDLDLDLDFSADDVPAPAPAPEAPSIASANETMKLPAQDSAASNGLDFDIPELEAPAAAPEPVASAAPELPDLTLSLDDLSLNPAPAPVEAPALPDIEQVAQAAPAKADDGMLEFDLGSLSLDLGTPEASADANGSDFGDGSLETKLALAEEFVSIGDQDGARALIEEVVAEATGELREKAQRALANLS